MRTVVVLLACLSAFATAVARQRSAEEMRQIARQQLSKAAMARSTAPHSDANDDVQELKATVSYHVYGSNGHGFVIVSTDDDFRPVLGYSDSCFDEQRLPDGLQWWLEAMDASLQWRKATHSLTATVPYTPTENFISTTWDQLTPYNLFCPQRCPTGCVATAMAQILRYYRYPAQSTGSCHYIYVSEKSETLNTTFRWDSMLDKYDYKATTEQREAVAELMRDCGYAAFTEYAKGSSSTDLYSTALGLVNNLGFSSDYLTVAERDLYSDEEWMSLVYGELGARRPILYGATDATFGGHAFVFSGINAEGLVWVNWGWSGDGDGWFDVSNLSPKYPRVYHFDKFQAMVYNIHPAPEEAGMSRTPKSLFAMYENDDSEYPCNYELTATGTTINITGANGAGAYNLHYLPFTGTIELHLTNEADATSTDFTLTTLEALDVYDGIDVDFSVDASSLADGTYTAFVASKDQQEQRLVPVRCLGGPLTFTLTKQGADVQIGEVTAMAVPTTTDSTAPVYYNLNGHKQSTPGKGVNIMRLRDGSTRKISF